MKTENIAEDPQSNFSTAGRITGMHLLLIFAMALLIRLIIFMIAPYSHEPYEDSAQYDNMGWNLANGRGFSKSSEAPYEPTARRPPLYPSFLALCYTAIGRDYSGVKLIQCFIGAITCVLIYLIALKALPKREVLVSGIIISLWPSIALYSNRLLSETPFLFLIALCILCTYKAIDIKSYRWGAITGALIGAAALCRPEALLLPIALLVLPVILCGNRRKGLVCGVIGIAAFSLVIMPWIVRNYAVFGRLIPLATGAGKIASGYRNRAEQDTILAPERHIYLMHLMGKSSERQDRDAPLLHAPDEDREAMVSGWGYMLSHPAEYLKYCAIRFYQLWKPASWSQIFGMKQDFIYYFRHGEYLVFSLKLFLLLINMAAIGLGWIGVFLLIRRWRDYAPLFATVGYFTVTYCALHAISRYRVPIMPYILIFGTYAIFTLAGHIRKKSTSLSSVNA